VTAPLRPAWFELDLTAAADNLRVVRRLVGPARKIFAVVKADAYGFGSVVLGRTFVAAGADALAVADVAEGIRLREAGIAVPILVYPNALPDAAAGLLAARLTPVATDVDTARAYAAVASDPVDLFVKVDVGLERLGVPADQAVKTITAIRETPRVRLAGVCTHLHVPAGADRAYVVWQFTRFTAVLDALAAQGVEVPVRLAASSPLVLEHPDTYLNAVDPGRMLYGVDPADRGGRVPVRSVFGALKSRLIEVKDVAPRDRFADAAPFPIHRPMRLGVIPMGAGDGLHHLVPDRVLVRERSVPVLARPSLEHTRLDLTAVPDARVGDEVVLIGRQGRAAITCDEVAARSGLHPLHLALAIGPRVARVPGSGA
jgi:alanine racemase